MSTIYYTPVPRSTFLSTGGLSMVLNSRRRLVYDLCSNLRDPGMISLGETWAWSISDLL